MRKVATDTSTLSQRIDCGLERSRFVIVKADVMVNPIADRFDTRPAGWQRTEETIRFIGHFIGEAEAARERVEEYVVG